MNFKEFLRFVLFLLFTTYGTEGFPYEVHGCRRLSSIDKLIENGKCVRSEKCPYLLEDKNVKLSVIVNKKCFQPELRDQSISYLCCGKDESTENFPKFSMHESDYSECGKSIAPLGPTDRIYGGETSEFGSYTWHALLRYKNAKIFACAGTVISSKYVLTAAHCVAPDLVKEIGHLQSVVLALNNLIDVRRYEYTYDKYDPRHKEIVVRATITHPNYVANQKYNDIAILRLNEEINFKELNIVPICLPGQDFKDSKINDEVTVIGFGRTLENPQSYDLRKLKLPIVSKNQCEPKFTNRKIVSSQICAGGILHEDTCDGDSGGALMVLRNGRWILEGLTSYGVVLCGTGVPSVFTRITSYLDWILAIMET